jgi:hypothetical protein
MQYRKVSITNTYTGKTKWRIQWRMPLFGWWFYHDNDWCCTSWDTEAEAEKYLNELLESKAKVIVKVHE